MVRKVYGTIIGFSIYWLGFYLLSFFLPLTTPIVITLFLHIAVLFIGGAVTGWYTRKDGMVFGGIITFPAIVIVLLLSFFVATRYFQTFPVDIIGIDTSAETQQIFSRGIVIAVSTFGIAAFGGYIGENLFSSARSRHSKRRRR